jgi:hypothetical protein
MTLPSERIINKLRETNLPFHANDNISRVLDSNDITDLKKEVEQKVLELLKSLVIDIDNDHNTHDTARRVAKMYVDEVFAGRYQKRPDITVFPNIKDLDELYTLRSYQSKECVQSPFRGNRGVLLGWCLSVERGYRYFKDSANRRLGLQTPPYPGRDEYDSC